MNTNIPQNQRYYPTSESTIDSSPDLKKSFTAFMDSIKPSLYSIVNASVISVVENPEKKSHSYVLLKIDGRKAEAKVPLNEFYLNGYGMMPMVGDSVAVYCKGSLISFTIAKFKTKFQTLTKLYKDREIVQGIVYNQTKFGFEILVLNHSVSGVIGFLHSQEADAAMIRNLTKFKECAHPYRISRITGGPVPTMHLTRKISDIIDATQNTK